MNYKEALEHFNEYRQMDADKWGLFFLGVQLFLGSTRIYASEKTARRRIMEEIKVYTVKPYPPHQYYHTSESQFKKELAKYEVDKKKYEEQYSKNKTAAEKIMNDLEATGMLEIRKVGDRTPKFPRNIKGLDEHQIKRFETMLDANDPDMVNLGITILKEIKKNEKENSGK